MLQAVKYTTPSPEAQLVTFAQSGESEEYSQLELSEKAVFEKGQLIAKLFDTTGDDGSHMCEFFVGRVTTVTKSGPWVKFLLDKQEIKQASCKIPLPPHHSV